MKFVLSAVTAAVIAFSSSSAGSASAEQGRLVQATELEANAIAYKDQRVSVDEMACAYVQGVYMCAHRTAKLIVIAPARPTSFQQYVERGCGTAADNQTRCMTTISFRVNDVKWEAQAGQVRTAILTSALDIDIPGQNEAESTSEGSEGALPIRANEFAELFNKITENYGIGDLKASPSQCERTQQSTLCRYRIGEHSVLTMVASGESSRARELALTSSIDTLARQQMVKTSMQLIIELVAPREYPEVKAEALSALLRKADEAQRHPRRAQLVSQTLGAVELLSYQDLQGQVNFNVRGR